MKEQTFFVRVFVVLFFIIIELIIWNIWWTRGETEKKNLRKNETKRHNCVCDCNTKNTMFWGRKKKEEEKQQQPKKKKICCACPETKEPRDQCVGEFGAEDERCKKLVEAHLVCLRKEGFDV
jgi:cytochrome c oxidase assembly protein subunit 17